LRFIRDNLPVGDPFPVASGKCIAKMDQNESPWDLSDHLKDVITDDLKALPWTRYSQPSEYFEVKKIFARTIGVDPEYLAITNGCDGAIQGIHFLAGGCQRRGLCFTPTYPMLFHAGRLAGTEMNTIDIGPEFQLPETIPDDYNLILIANPNNPTGNLTPDSVLETALNTNAMVFVDEAYYDFSGKTWINRIAEYPNLAIGRSCSKAMLAGVRLGALIARPEVITRYESLVTAPYHLSHLQMVVARRYGDLLPRINELTHQISEQREFLCLAMQEIGIQTLNSVTNFILFKVPDPQKVFDHLTQQGIRIRNMTKIPGLDSHLRVTVGKPEQNTIFLDALKTALNDLNF